MTARFSRAQQMEAVNFALTRQRTLARGGTVKGLRGTSTEEFDCQRLEAVVKTFDWLQDNERDIKAFLRLPPAGRKAALEMAAAHPGPEGGST
jgi:hypothetical protein